MVALQSLLGILTAMLLPVAIYLILAGLGFYEIKTVWWAASLIVIIVAPTTLFFGLYLNNGRFYPYFITGALYVLGNTIFYIVYYFKYSTAGHIAVLNRNLSKIKKLIEEIEKGSVNNENIKEQLEILKKEYKEETNQLKSCQIELALQLFKRNKKQLIFLKKEGAKK